MVDRRVWFDRKFDLGLPVEALPDLIERLRGTPGRLEERISVCDPAHLTDRPNNRWSVQEHAGHLLDLEDLWTGRLDDFRHQRPELRPADIRNTKTEEARHNESPLREILERFRATRLGWVSKLERMTDTQVKATSLHPRLQQPMSVVDLAFFVAEHDDHHLADITEIIRSGHGTTHE